MFVDCSCRVHLESVHAEVHKGSEVVHPVLLSGLRSALAFSDKVFFGYAEVIFLAKPKTEVISHIAQLPDKQAVVEFLRIFVDFPVWFYGKFLGVEFLFCAEVISFLHPLRLKPEQVARNFRLPEMNGIVEDVPLVFPHIRTETEAVSPFWKQV